MSSTSVTAAPRYSRVSTDRRAPGRFPSSPRCPPAPGVGCVIMPTPVIDPPGGCHYVKQLKAKGQPYPQLVDEVLPCHDAYWQSEDAMAEGSPALTLERGETIQLPPVLYLQGAEDLAHPRPHLDRFVAAYRKAGGVVDLELFDGEGQGFIMRKAGSPASNRAIELIIEFVHKQVTPA